MKFQGWEYLCSGIDLPTYPNFVKKFYTNAIFSPRSFETEVKGLKINLTREKLGILLHAPNEGVEKLDDKAAGLRFLFGRDDAMHFEEIHARNLFVEHILLHHMSIRIFLPRLRRFDFLIKNDIAVIYHTLRKKKIQSSYFDLKG